MKQCNEKECNKRAISFSDCCGEHTDNASYALTLNNLEPGKYSEIFISEMELENLSIKELHFYDSTIEDCQFTSGQWNSIRFDFSSLKSCLFENVMLTDIIVEEESIWASCTFYECEFSKLAVEVVSLSNGEFRKTSFSNTLWDQSLLTQVDFLDCQFSVLEMTVCGLDTVSFQHCSISNAKVSDIKLALTFCIDTIVEKSDFSGELMHDFQHMNDPFELCLFQGCKIAWDLSIDGFKYWNGIDEDPLFFYWRVLDRISSEVHVGNLSPVQFLVSRIMDLTPDNTSLAKRLSDLFTVYFADIRARQDLSGFGELASLMSRLPQELIINKAKYLPSPKNLNSKNVLRIEIAHSVDNLISLQEVINRFQHLDSVMSKHGLDPLIVEDFKKGSVVIVLSSTVITIITILAILYKTGHLFLDTENKILTNKKLKRENKNAKKEDELLGYELTLKKQEITLNDLEIKRRKQDLKTSQLPDTYIAVTKDEMVEYSGEDPFDHLEVNAQKEIKEAANEVLELGDTNVYIELIEKALA